MQVRVLITDHAIAKLATGEQRSLLTPEEIELYITEQKTIILGTNHKTGTVFLLAWDDKLKKPIVFLTKVGKNVIAVVSIWNIDFDGIPNGKPSEKQIDIAQSLLAPR